jgi:hypothetical protein
MNVRTMFETELRQRSINFTIDPASGRHAVETRTGSSLVNLDNLERDVAQDGDVGRISRFVDAILATDQGMSPERLYWNLEPNDYKEPADFRVAVSDKVDRVLVHLSADGRLIDWVTPAMLESLAMSKIDASNAAFANLAKALAEATFHSQDIDGIQLAMIGSKLPFKAALILAPNIKEVLGNKVGWPLLAVLPDRNFLYMWAARHAEFVNRVGAVVVREYSRASYPISTEVFEIADNGIRAIGAFPPGAPPGAASTDGLTMKTITYRGGIARFQLPADWVEKYEESGGGTFYKPGDATGTLRLNVMTFQAPPGKAFTSSSVAELLAAEPAKHGLEIVPLRDGVALTQYDHESEEAGHRTKIRFWRIGQIVSQQQARMVLFSYTLLEKQFSQPRFVSELEMLDREIAACELASVVGESPATKKEPRWRPW